MRNALIILTVLIVGGVVAVCYVLHINPLKRLKHAGVRVDNLERSFYYHVPEGVIKNPKLIFVLHGSSGTGKMMQMLSGHEFDKIADAEKDVIIVYPDGYHKYWNDCRKMGTYEPKKLNLDDVGFFGKMISYFREKYNIDTGAVFAVGFSNGGQMCYKLAKEKPQWFKGIASVSANLPVDENNDCYETHAPVSILVMNGTADPFNPYNGGDVTVPDGNKRGAVRSTGQTMQYWLGNDSCAATPASMLDFADINKDDNSTAVAYLYKSNITGKQVELVKIINGGHIFPNRGFSLWPGLLGPVNKDIDAPEVICTYFKGL